MESIKIYYKECSATDLSRFHEAGGIILDVRPHTEFAGGHISGAMNIPLDKILKNLYRIPNKHQPIITYCTSGMKSASAKILLDSLGYTRVCNGGSFKYLQDNLVLHGTSSI